MNINEFLQQHKVIKDFGDGFSYRENAPKVVCADGFTMSVQVSRNHYCDPRSNDAPTYFKAEIGYPSEREELIMRYAEQSRYPTETVYGYVPVAIIDEVIAKHGGFKTES